MVTKYEVIKSDIVEKIEKGIFQAGEKIYSESDLKKMYSVSNTTVVKALNDLVNDGYLIRRQGEGTFVRRNLKHRKVLFSEKLLLSDKKNGKAIEETITVISNQLIDTGIAKKLGDKTGEKKLIRLSQIALINDFPWKIQNRYLFSEKLNDKALQRLAKGSSLSKELQLEGNMASLPMVMEVHAVLLAKDSKELDPLRQCKRSFGNEENYALFNIDRLTLDKDNNPIEYSQNYIHPDYYSLEIIGD